MLLMSNHATFELSHKQAAEGGERESECSTHALAHTYVHALAHAQSFTHRSSHLFCNVCHTGRDLDHKIDSVID